MAPEAPENVKISESPPDASHPEVECGITSCTHNKQFNTKYGYCNSPENIVLKFRAYLDIGKGGIVYLECLNQQLPQDKEE